MGVLYHTISRFTMKKWRKEGAEGANAPNPLTFPNFGTTIIGYKTYILL